MTNATTETATETSARLGAKFAETLRAAGLRPVYAAVGRVFMAEFATQPEADKCAAHFAKLGCVDVSVIAADDDCGPTVTMRLPGSEAGR